MLVGSGGSVKIWLGEGVMPIVEKKIAGSNLWNGVKHMWDCFLLNCEMIGLSDMRWKNSIDGVFSVRSTYSLIAKFDGSPNIPLFKFIWKWNGVERVHAHLWKVANGSLATNEKTWQRGFTDSWSCIMWESEKETIFCCLRNYEAIAIWMEVNPFFI